MLKEVFVESLYVFLFFVFPLVLEGIMTKIQGITKIANKKRRAQQPTTE